MELSVVKIVNNNDNINDPSELKIDKENISLIHCFYHNTTGVDNSLKITLFKQIFTDREVSLSLVIKQKRNLSAADSPTYDCYYEFSKRMLYTAQTHPMVRIVEPNIFPKTYSTQVDLNYLKQCLMSINKLRFKDFCQEYFGFPITLAFAKIHEKDQEVTIVDNTIKEEEEDTIPAAFVLDSSTLVSINPLSYVPDPIEVDAPYDFNSYYDTYSYNFSVDTTTSSVTTTENDIQTEQYPIYSFLDFNSNTALSSNPFTMNEIKITPMEPLKVTSINLTDDKPIHIVTDTWQSFSNMDSFNPMNKNIRFRSEGKLYGIKDV